MCQLKHLLLAPVKKSCFVLLKSRAWLGYTEKNQSVYLEQCGFQCSKTPQVHNRGHVGKDDLVTHVKPMTLATFIFFPSPILTQICSEISAYLLCLCV